MVKRRAALLIVAGICAAVVVGQLGQSATVEAAQDQFSNPQIDEQSAILILSAILDLTDDQAPQLRADFESAAKAAAPIAAQMQATKEALFQAAKSANGGGQIEKLAAQEGSLATQMARLQAQTFAKMWAMLSDKQKAQVDATMYNEIGGFLSVASPPTATAPTVPPSAAK